MTIKATVQIIGDYDECAETYAITLLATEQEVIESGIDDGDEVEIRIIKKGRE